MKTKRLVIAVLLTIISLSCFGQEKVYRYTGKVIEKDGGQPVVGAVVFTSDKKISSVSANDGSFNLQLKNGNYTVNCSCIGYKDASVSITIKGKDVIEDILLDMDSYAIQEAKVVSVNSKELLRTPQMGVSNLEMSTVRKIPALFGENDIIRAIQMLPGVQCPSEGATGFSVRGGGVDQNLILLDGAPIYSSGHFLGFLSMFNGDAVNNVTLYKGDFPVIYGEKASSVLDVTTLDGNMDHIAGNFSIGLISSKVAIQGPIVKSKLSFSLAARRSYADLFIPFVKSIPEGSHLHFADINAKLTWAISDKDRISLSAFSSNDELGMELKDYGVDNLKAGYRNNTQSLRYFHDFSDSFHTSVTAYNSMYDMKTVLDMDAIGNDWKTKLIETGIRNSYSWHANSNNHIQFGVDLAMFQLSPSETYPHEDSEFSAFISPKTYAFQPALYLQNEQTIGKLKLRYGVRLSSFSTMGETDQYYYDPETHERTDSIHFGHGQFIKTYFALDPRISASFVVSDNVSLKAAAARTHQYIQQTSLSTSPGVMDVWYTASPNVKPLIVDMACAGFNWNFFDDALKLTTEAYYKHGTNVPDLKENPGNLYLNEDREALLRFGTSNSYGVEANIEYDIAGFSGWVGYCWSKAMYNIPEINDGKPYHSPLNHEHAVDVVVMYKIGKRMEASASWVFYSGAPTSYPVARFKYAGLYTPVYSSRNEDSLPDYHRLDLSFTIRGKRSLEGKRWSGEWNFSIYNVYGRHNAWAIAYGYNEEQKQMNSSLVYLFSVVPSVSYTLKF